MSASTLEQKNIQSYIAPLLAPNTRWGTGSPNGTPAAVTYSFMQQVPDYYAPDAVERANFVPFSSEQADAARKILKSWSDVANITFQEVSDQGEGGQIRFGTADGTADELLGWAFEPIGNTTGDDGDVWLNNNDEILSSANQNMTPGSSDFATLMHEMGHALGLKHPGKYQERDIEPFLPPSQDNRQYTVMAYNSHPAYLSTSPRSPLLYDIAAIQTLYGANMTTRTGNDTYSWGANESFIEAIWDAGGVDTINASNQVQNAVIDLRDGGFSSIGVNENGAAKDNLAIAFGVTIENAIGGGGNDLIVGNSIDNLMQGNLGNDSLFGEAGNDILEGGAGDDKMLGGQGNDVYIVDSITDQITEYVSEGADIVRSSASYTLSDNLEELYLTDIAAINGTGNSLNNKIFGNAASNYLYAGDGADIIESEAGDDYLDGQAGDDNLIGGAGKDQILGDLGNDRIIGGADADNLVGGLGEDWLSGGANRDTLRGGLDADRFVFDSLGRGADRIADFKATQDDQIVVSAKGFSKKLKTGRLTQDQFTTGSQATSEDAQFIYNTQKGDLFFDADGMGGRRQVLFAELAPKSVLSRADITVIA